MSSRTALGDEVLDTVAAVKQGSLALKDAQEHHWTSCVVVRNLYQRVDEISTQVPTTVARPVTRPSLLLPHCLYTSCGTFVVFDDH